MTFENNKKLNFSNIFNFFGFWMSFCFISYCLRILFINNFSNFNFYNILTIFEMHNKGAAFSILENYSQIISIASIIVLVILSIVLIINSNKITMYSISAMGMLSAGITMNLIDRIKDGYVTDYISLNLLPNFATVFNIPDVMIIIGAGILIFRIIKSK